MSRRHQGSCCDALGAADFAAAFAGLEAARHVLAAVSGGPDSTALLGGLAEWTRDRGGPALSVATVDHGLRPGSRAEAEAVGAFARSLALSHTILTWEGRKGRPVSQAAARDARYGLLLDHARAVGATHLLTAHTLDDQAETLMLRLAAGSGLSGLGGMRREVARGDVLHARPFLHLPKTRLVATCRERSWPFVEDPSNVQARFARVRWRQTIIPLLASEGLDAVRLGRLGERLARADEALDRAADSAFSRFARYDRAVMILDFAALSLEAEEIALRVLQRALASPEPASRHLRLERLEECLSVLLQARAGGTSVRRTIAGRLLTLDANGMLTISVEGTRRRGRGGAVTQIDIPDGPSLGREPGRA